MCSFFHWCCFYTRMFLLTRFHQRLLPIYMSFILKAQWGYFCCQFMDSEEYVCFPAINPAYVAVSSQARGKWIGAGRWKRSPLCRLLQAANLVGSQQQDVLEPRLLQKVVMKLIHAIASGKFFKVLPQTADVQSSEGSNLPNHSSA